MVTALRKPIGLAEFQAAFLATWNKSEPARFGLALSGGVDSMALAYLWSLFINSSPRSLWSSSRHPVAFFQSFVVDHGARKGSAEEAQLVATRLEKLLGKRPSILRLSSGILGAAGTHSGFETRARSLRYRILGEASLANRVQGILLAHHANDKAETALLRLAHNTRAAFLSAPKPNAQFPECFGLYGVYESGEHQMRFSERHRLGGPESGGLRAIRPLLEFPKSRLEATCLEAGVEWVEDQTNYDPTFTLRNSVRSLIESDALPAALRAQSILQSARKLRGLGERQNEFVRLLYRSCRMLSFDIRSGFLRIWTPYPGNVFGSGFQNWDKDARTMILGIFLRTLAQSVSPLEVVELRKARAAIDNIFPDLETGHVGPRVCSFGLVMFEPQIQPDVTTYDGGTTYLIYRAPPGYHKSSSIDMPANDLTAPSSTPFHLWDGRFWIRIKNCSSTPLRIEHLTPRQLGKLKLKLHSKKKKKFEYRLHECAPGRVRWSLPAIVLADTPNVGPEEKEKGLEPRQSNIEQDSGSIVALPTIGWVLEDFKGKLFWDIRYKKISLGGLQKVDDFVLKPRHDFQQTATLEVD